MAPALGACSPAAHGRQLSEPVALTNFPASQSKHSAWPVPPWYFPAGHGSHRVELALRAYVPLAQASQLSLPAAPWKRPASHRLHVVLPDSSWWRPIAQFLHVSAPASLVKVPGAQSVQALGSCVVSGFGLNLPAGHALHLRSLTLVGAVVS